MHGLESAAKIDKSRHIREMSQSPSTSYFSPWGCNQSGPGNVNSFK